MRLITILFFSFLLQSSGLLGQRAAKFWWFDTGVKAQYGATGIYSKALADSDSWRFDINTGYSVGAKFGLNKGTSGLTLDGMYAQGEQSYERAAVPDGSADVKVNWSSFDLYTLYRNNRQLGYFEVGPKFSFLQNAEIADIDGENALDITNQFNNNYVSAVLGFGAYFIGSDGAFSGILGLRFEYGLTDALNADGHAAGAPVQDVNLFDAGITNTAPIFAGLSFELNWGIGYVGKASCGGRAKFIKF